MYAVTAALGLATYVLIYGADHLVGAGAYWTMPQMDERMALMGYRYFLSESWQWPVFTSHAIDVPYATSVAFNDCIPIWALLNKLLATVIPPWRAFSADAFLGLWHGLAYALQACFGVACLRALGHRSWRTAIVAALFVLATPAWIARYGHPALSAHWVELWAIWLYLVTPRAPMPTRLGLAMLGQLAIAALITPYHPALCLPIFIAAVVRSRHRRTMVQWIPLGLVTVAIATWFAGYFSGEGGVAQWGFHAQSTNVLSWLVPVRSGIIGDGRWIANVMATDWQWEGYAYLGLGYLALLALFVPRIESVRGVIRRHPILFALALGCWLFALSNHIYFGGYELASYDIPRALRWVTQQFRAPGRFVWVPMYVAMLFLLHHAFTRFTGRRFAIVIIAVAIQWLDVRADWAFQRAWTTKPWATVLDQPAWRAMIHAHEAVVIEPTYACIVSDEAWVFDLASGVQLLASERAVPINGTYSARTSRVCADEERAWAALTPQPGTLYVLLPQARAVAAQLVRGGATCTAFQTAQVCAMDGAVLARLPR